MARELRSDREWDRQESMVGRPSHIRRAAVPLGRVRQPRRPCARREPSVLSAGDGAADAGHRNSDAVKKSGGQMDHYPMLLSQREREIAALVATAASNKEIARELGISIKTVKNTLTNVFVKTGARSRTELALLLVLRQAS
ncbi:MAG: helix-turn-helix transcriptional regulator [Chloroflexi bacterium]|nr:helix-turn-helix transcriptional regulator [Chloroflexota bacterium]